MCSVPRDVTTSVQQYMSSLVHRHVQFGTGRFRYQDHFGTKAISVSVIDCNAERITFYKIHAFIIHQHNGGISYRPTADFKKKMFFWPTL